MNLEEITKPLKVDNSKSDYEQYLLKVKILTRKLSISHEIFVRECFDGGMQFPECANIINSNRQ